MNKDAVVKQYRDFISENNLIPSDAIMTTEACAVILDLVVETFEIEIYLHPQRFDVVVNNHNLTVVDESSAQYSNKVRIYTHQGPRYHVVRNGVAFQTPDGVLSDTHHEYATDIHLALKSYMRQRITANEMLKILPTEVRMNRYIDAVIIPQPEVADIWVEFNGLRTWWSCLLPCEQRTLWDEVRVM